MTPILAIVKWLKQALHAQNNNCQSLKLPLVKLNLYLQNQLKNSKPKISIIPPRQLFKISRNSVKLVRNKQLPIKLSTFKPQQLQTLKPINSTLKLNAKHREMCRIPIRQLYLCRSIYTPVSLKHLQLHILSNKHKVCQHRWSI